MGVMCVRDTCCSFEMKACLLKGFRMHCYYVPVKSLFSVDKRGERHYDPVIATGGIVVKVEKSSSF